MFFPSRPRVGSPHDHAVVKFLVGRPEDLALVRELYSSAQLKSAIVRERIMLLPIPVGMMHRLLDSYRSIFLG